MHRAIFKNRQKGTGNKEIGGGRNHNGLNGLMRVLTAHSAQLDKNHRPPYRNKLRNYLPN